MIILFQLNNPQQVVISYEQYMLNKHYYYEVRQFKEIDTEAIREINSPSTYTIFLHKQGHSKVQVWATGVQRLIHGWRIQHIHIAQRKNDNILVYHWRQFTIPFPTDIILSALSLFSKHISCQIDARSSRISDTLRLWMQAQIDQLFLVESKGEDAFNCENTFLNVQSLYRLRYKCAYECVAWRAKIWDKLLELVQGEGIKENDCFSKLFERCLQFIVSVPPLDRIRYRNMFVQEDKKEEKVTRGEMELQREKEKEVMRKYKLEGLLEK